MKIDCEILSAKSSFYPIRVPIPSSLQLEELISNFETEKATQNTKWDRVAV